MEEWHWYGDERLISNAVDWTEVSQKGTSMLFVLDMIQKLSSFIIFTNKVRDVIFSVPPLLGVNSTLVHRTVQRRTWEASEKKRTQNS